MRRIEKLSEALEGAAAPGRALRICVVTSEILGPVKNGGIGTATTGLIEHLMNDKHEVTVLYTSVEFGTPACEEKDWAYWVSQWAHRKVELAHIAHTGDYRMWRRKSWLVKDFLGERDFDIVFFNEHHGSGYYALAAKRAGIPRFSDRTHCVITHGSIEWVFDVNDQYIRRPSDVEMIGLERRSVEWADVVVGPSEYLLRKYESYGWILPEQTFVQPYPFRLGEIQPSSSLIAVSELVFFGRLETRKGLWLFCEALDELAETLRGRVVTFMGRMTDVGGVTTAAFLLERAANWPFQVRLLTRLNQPDAIEYLRQPGRLAVMPSLADNSPCVVYECLTHRIPFVTTSGTGADELIHPDCQDAVMVKPTLGALSERLRTILDTGAALAWPRFDPGENLRTWSKFAEWMATTHEATGAQPPHDKTTSLLGTKRLMLVTFDPGSGSLSAMADRTLRHAQRYGASTECLILTSRRGSARELLEELTRSSTSMGPAQIIVMGTESIGAAVEAMIRADILFFTDSDHEILPQFLVSAISAMMQHGAAAVSCMSAERLDTDGSLRIVELPCGDLPAAGGLGLPIGSSVWAALSTEIRSSLTLDAIYQEESGGLATASSLGQALMHELILSNRDVVLIPSVGAISERNAGGYSRRRHWYGEAEETARRLRIDPLVHSGSAAWLGLSAARHATTSEPEGIVGLDLPAEHPLSSSGSISDHPEALSLLAAAMGRPDQAVGLWNDWRVDPETIQSLLDVAQTSADLRKPIDLLTILVEQRSRSLGRLDAGRESSPELRPAELRQRLLAAVSRRTGASLHDDLNVPLLPDGSGSQQHVGTVQAAEPSFPFARAFSDDLQVTLNSNAAQVIATGRRLASSGRLTFIDIPLAGHERIRADLILEENLSATVRLNVVEQITGGEIAGGIWTVSESRVRLTVDLPGIFDLACIRLSVETEGGGSRGALRFGLIRFTID